MISNDKCTYVQSSAVDLLLIILSIFLLCFNGSANTVENVNLTLHADQFNITKDDNGFDVIEMNGFFQPLIPGDPMLPRKNFNVLIPPGINDSSLNLKIISAETKVLNGTYEIKPSPPLVSGNNNLTTLDWSKKETVLAFKNAEIYATNPTFRINTPIHNIFCSPVRVALEPSPESRSALFAV
jgi:hypothetical protein